MRRILHCRGPRDTPSMRPINVSGRQSIPSHRRASRPRKELAEGNAHHDVPADAVAPSGVRHHYTAGRDAASSVLRDGDAGGVGARGQAHQSHPGLLGCGELTGVRAHQEEPSVAVPVHDIPPAILERRRITSEHPQPRVSKALQAHRPHRWLIQAQRLGGRRRRIRPVLRRIHLRVEPVTEALAPHTPGEALAEAEVALELGLDVGIRLEVAGPHGGDGGLAGVPGEATVGGAVFSVDGHLAQMPSPVYFAGVHSIHVLSLIGHVLLGRALAHLVGPAQPIIHMHRSHQRFLARRLRMGSKRAPDRAIILKAMEADVGPADRGGRLTVLLPPNKQEVSVQEEIVVRAACCNRNNAVS
mmetsp:Transcript_42562/g.102584  ORF Transcript_42562/g.102584 Transcript_42562/m.102584 type:complete len:358 (-) Transcript_42562:2890-3963(-)